MVLVQNVSKVYHLYKKPSDRLWEALGTKRDRGSQFWALRDVSFSVAQGEVLGIVGPNGSGKSTVLQVVSGILRPTSGRVSVEGRIAALLELGAGFNPEFSGRENVYLSCEIMGLSRTGTQRLFGSIEAFAEIGEFIDRPVKEYSTGMYVRLAFATAIHVDPDVLIIDEALAVGDAIFSNRCIRKLEELRQRKVTILFVSHDLGLVKRLCDRAILMLKGSVLAEGSPSEVVNKYVAIVHDQQAATREPSAGVDGIQRHGDRTSVIDSVSLVDSSGRSTATVESGDLVSIVIGVRFEAAAANPIVGMLIRTRLGTDVFGTNTRLEQVELGSFEAGDRVEIRFQFPCSLTKQEYTLTVASQHANGASQDWRDDLLQFSVMDSKDIAGVAHLRTQIAWRAERAR